MPLRLRVGRRFCVTIQLGFILPSKYKRTIDLTLYQAYSQCMADMENMENKPKEKLLQALIPEHLWVRLKVTAAINRTSVAALVADMAAALPAVEEATGVAES